MKEKFPLFEKMDIEIEPKFDYGLTEERLNVVIKWHKENSERGIKNEIVNESSL